MGASEGIPQDLLTRAINESRDGITIADARKAGYPVCYVNAGFERITGYKAEEVIGASLNILQGSDTAQPEAETMRAALARGEGCEVTLRNYRKDGTMFWNELGISPVHDEEGTLTHFIGIQKDETARIMLDENLHQTRMDMATLSQQINVLMYTDPLIGISNRRRFDEQFISQLAAARRTHSALTVLMINVDHFKEFNKRYGTSAGDESLRIVGDCIAKSFSRSSDCAARYGGAMFSVLSLGDGREELLQHAQKLCEKVRALNIPHGDSTFGIVTVSIGGVSRVPTRETTPEELVQLAEAALYAAKHRGRNQANIVS